MSINNLKRKYESAPVQVRASFWFFICSFLQRGISMITTPIFTRIMTTEDYGQFGVFNSWYGIISIIVALALTGGVHTQGLIKYDKERKQFTSSLQGLTITMIVFWLLIYIFFSDCWNRLFSLSSVQMISMFVIIWITAVFGFWANEQRVIYSYRALVIITLISSVIKPMLQIVLVLHSTEKTTARVLGWAISDMITFGWMFFSQMREGKSFFSKRFWTYAFAFNLPLVPHYLSQTVLNSADRIMIRRMVGDGQSGIYNLAYSISLIMTLFNMALTQTINPWMYQKIKDREINCLAPIAYLTLIIIGAANLFLILFAPDVVAVFAPKSYYEAIWVIPPVAMSVYFMYAYDLFAKFAFYYEKTKVIMLASLLGAFLNIILNYFFINRFGYIAAGYTTLLCFIVYSGTHYLFMKKVCRECCDGVYPYNTRIVFFISGVFLLFGFLFLATYRERCVRYSIMTVLIVMAVVFRKRLIKYAKDLISLRKSEE